MTAKRSSHSATPFYAGIEGKDAAWMARYRKTVELECQTVKGARDVWCMASRDLLWCVNTLCWTYNSRDLDIAAGDEADLQWLTWDFQDDSMLKMQAAVGKHDVVSQKSRQLGWTWMMIGVFWWFWMFRRNLSFLLVSRTQDLVELKGSKDCMLWRFDYLTQHLPALLRPPQSALDNKLLHRYNPWTGTSVDGASTTKDIGRGGVRTAIGVDEFAAFDTYQPGLGNQVLGATQAVTNCRIFNSTHRHEGTAFNTVCNSHTRKITTMWWQHPDRCKGLYTSEGGRFIALDAGYDYPLDDQGNACSYIIETDDGPFYQPLILDGKDKRSPYYDYQSIERLHNIPTLIAAELDCDAAGSAYQVFEGAERPHKAAHAEDPMHVGELQFTVAKDDLDASTLTFVEGGKCDLSLWINLVGEARVPRGRQYIVSSDIAAGGHDSTHVVYEQGTREKVAEVVCKRDPREHAELGVALCILFNDAYHIWDATGPTGAIYGRRIASLSYGNIFYRYTNEHSRKKKPTDKPGFSFSGGLEVKGYILGNYRDALKTNAIVNRSARALAECGRIIYGAGGKIEHSAAVANDDPTASKDNHADLVIADALAFRAFDELETPAAEKADTGPPPGSIGWFRQGGERFGFGQQADAQRSWRFSR